MPGETSRYVGFSPFVHDIINDRALQICLLLRYLEALEPTTTGIKEVGLAAELILLVDERREQRAQTLAVRSYLI